MKKQNKILEAVLQELRPTALPPDQMAALNAFKQEVRELLQKTFPKGKYACADPIEMGSLKKKTSISLCYDLDLLVPFKREAFNDEKALRSEVFKALANHSFRSKTEVRNQRNSIGLQRYVGSQLLSIDVVPGLERKAGDFQLGKSEDDLFLVIYDREVGRPTITNVHRQVRVIKQSIPLYRDTIRLLKAWRLQQPNDFPLGSYALEMMVYAAARATGAPPSGNHAKLLVYVLTYCIEQLQGDWKLVDVGSGKVWADYLKKGAKDQLAGLWRKLLSTIQDGEETSIRRCFLG
jgi:hypothetical protein